MTLFERNYVVGTFLGFSQGGLEFHAELVLPYRNEFQREPMHGQFVVVALEHDNEAVLGRITTMSAQGRLASGSGEDYAIRAVQEDRAIPEDLRQQYLKYRVDIRILGVIRERVGDRLSFVASHRRLPHVGAKVAFLAPELLKQVVGASDTDEQRAEIGFLALGEFVFSGDDERLGDQEWIQRSNPKVIPRFDISQLVSRRTFVFARAGFGKSNLLKLLFSNLYGGAEEPTVIKRGNRRVPVGTIIFDPDGEYFWPDDKGRPALADVPGLRDRLVVFTDRQAPSDFYGSFVADRVRLDIRELPPAMVVGLVISPERQENQNVIKIKQLGQRPWSELVDLIYQYRNDAELNTIKTLLKLEQGQDVEALAARGNMVRVVNSLHDPSTQLLTKLKNALGEGKLCVVDISRMRGAQGLALAGVILSHLFDHNQEQFTQRESRTIPTIAVIEEAQSVLGSGAGSEGPFVSWVKEGRKYDLGAVLVTQQPGSLPGELLSQGDNWFIFHLLSSGDLRALKNANAHFSDDLLSTLLNEPLVGHGVFWSSAGDSPTPYPIPIRALSFEHANETQDPDYSRPAVNTFASSLLSRMQEKMDAVLKRAAAISPRDPVDVDIVAEAAETPNNLDAVKTIAIEGLRANGEFTMKVQQGGIKWGRVLYLLADEIDSDLVGMTSSDWVHQQNLVPQALDTILGIEGWKTERRRDAQGKEALFVDAANASTLDLGATV